MALNFAYLVPWQTLSTLSWHLLTYEPRVFLSSEVLCLLASTYHNLTGLPNSSLTVWQCPQSMLCLNFFFFNFPMCIDSPVLVVLVSLPHTSPSLLSVVSPATVLGKKRVWTKEYLEASKGGIQILLMEVGSTWKHSVHLEKTLGSVLRCCFVVEYLAGVHLLPFLVSGLANVFCDVTRCSSAAALEVPTTP